MSFSLGTEVQPLPKRVKGANISKRQSYSTDSSTPWSQLEPKVQYPLDAVYKDSRTPHSSFNCTLCPTADNKKGEANFKLCSSCHRLTSLIPRSRPERQRTSAPSSIPTLTVAGGYLRACTRSCPSDSDQSYDMGLLVSLCDGANYVSGSPFHYLFSHTSVSNLSCPGMRQPHSNTVPSHTSMATRYRILPKFHHWLPRHRRP